MRSSQAILGAVALFLSVAGVARAAEPVVITEIMYNPASHEGGMPTADGTSNPPRTEWVEIYNAGSEAVSLAGWRLSDEDGQTQAIGEGESLAAGEVVVLVPADVTPEQFKAAWGEHVRVIGLVGWGRGGLGNLSNSPSDTNEILVLRNAADLPVDQVNYDDENGWPSDLPDGASIYVLPGHLTPDSNDSPAAWARSADGTHEARINAQTDIFDGQDIASPSKVATE